MAMSNRDRIARGLGQLEAGLAPFVEREIEARLGETSIEARKAAGRNRQSRDAYDARQAAPEVSAQALLGRMRDHWQEVFRHVLGDVERAYVGELWEMHGRWAAEEPFSSEDTERALDTMKRLLEAVSARAQADEVQRLKHDLQRTVFSEQARSKVRAQPVMEGMPRVGLRPWREVVTPHPDVASGQYMQAEFAADLAQVQRNEGSDEYRDPVEFFRRTYLTVGLHELLAGALQRLSGTGGDPVLELQTNFGGGKTHSMLALYHLFGGTPSSTLPGIESVLQAAGVAAAPVARRSVLVGTALSPGQAERKGDGTVVRTLWGELAWQLGGAEGYACVAESDERGVSPGSGKLVELFRRYAPALVLIDEWVAYARQVVGKVNMPAGDFESQSTFAQALTEAAKAVPKTLVVASIPASKIEYGGDNGALALDTLKNVFQRLGKAWRPATGDEGFEIVRRRLFEPIRDKDAFAHRDAVVQAFVRQYGETPGEYPDECSKQEYRRLLEESYPIHPELLRRLYDDWSTLDKFQRTRGVLRLLAKVIHRLWESQDSGLVILPACVPLDEGPTKAELVYYLPDIWEPILSQDVDGERSLPLEIDRGTPNLGRLSAGRRVARTLFVGTAPGAHGKNPGMDDRRVRLGCVQPGEQAAAFGDALRRLSDRGKYIHQDGNRYWLSTKPNLNRMAEDQASALQRDVDRLHAEIARRLKGEQRKRGLFAALHVCPLAPGDVADDPAPRLVVLPPRAPHRKGQEDSPALQTAREILESRGNGPRLERNALVFVAADKRELEHLLEATAQFLAWKQINDEVEGLNLDPFHHRQAKQKLESSDETVALRLQGSWIHVLAPRQAGAVAPIAWEEFKLNGQGGLAERVGSRLQREEALLPKLGANRLAMELDKVWGDRDHVAVGQLAEWFARYLYLPRLAGRETLIDAIREGLVLAPEAAHFASATVWDELQGRYRGLQIGGQATPSVSDNTLLVKLNVARRQKDFETSKPPPSAQNHQAVRPDGKGNTGANGRPAPLPPNLFVGSVRLDWSRAGRDAGRVADEVLAHLAALRGAECEVSLEIRVKLGEGAREDVIRTVSENANTLKFSLASFERE